MPKTNPPDIIENPIDAMQLDQLKVEWVPYSQVKPNTYNPNFMSWHERMLLRESLLEDGWTQPIVTLKDKTIVDGEQRWTTAGLDLKPEEIQEIIERLEKRKESGHPESESILFRLKTSKARLEAAIKAGLPANLSSITGGLVPITVLDLGDDAHKILSTIRHNRARGTHQIEQMAGLTKDLVQLGLDLDDLEQRLGMDDDEISRFLNMANEAQTLLELPDSQEYGAAWKPQHIADAIQEDPELKANLERSEQANVAMSLYEQQMVERNKRVALALEAKVQEAEAKRTKPLTQDEKRRLQAAVEKEIPKLEVPEPPSLVKIVFFITKEEAEIVNAVLGDTRAVALVDLCREALEKRKNGHE